MTKEELDFYAEENRARGKENKDVKWLYPKLIFLFFVVVNVYSITAIITLFSLLNNMVFPEFEVYVFLLSIAVNLMLVPVLTVFYYVSN